MPNVSHGDYRNRVRRVDFDPTKWLIGVLAWCGLVSDLRVFSENEVRKGQFQEGLGLQ